MPFAPISLRFNGTDRMAVDEEPNYYVHEHSGDLLLHPGEDEFTEIPIGKFSAWYSLGDVFDATQTVYDMYTALYRKWVLSPVAQRAGRLAEATEWTNVLYLNRIEVDEAWRGNFYGLAAMLGLMHHLQMGAGAVVLKAFPLDLEHCGGSSGKSDAEFREAQRKLMRYYMLAGFRRVGRSHYMIRGADWPLPELNIW
jgi:hypothetical protein